ncbi:uncharacterized protein LOC113344996 [Papaver somniferum]|uniref:uncharacterized protein LOC113344996 n=1 Tax=Papaver somniferum TaxID=3469 RepID=UPI000E6F58F3|nr:uncharacterized protein LOC113344996 [Papaver somniferum]
MSSINKIISKVISTRLKVVLPKIVSFQQSAYVEGRQIMDSVIIANECIDSARREHSSDYMLQRMGFGILWRKWIEAAISHVNFSVLVNGSSNGRFLFLIIAESLNLKFEKAAQIGWLQGSEITPGGSKITHLQFADDTLVFITNDQHCISHLRNILIWFEAISGLKWLWKFGEEDDPLWKNLIAEKYGLAKFEWNSKPPKQVYGCSIWRWDKKLILTLGLANARQTIAEAARNWYFDRMTIKEIHSYSASGSDPTSDSHRVSSQAIRFLF